MPSGPRWHRGQLAVYGAGIINVSTAQLVPLILKSVARLIHSDQKAVDLNDQPVGNVRVEVERYIFDED